MKYAFLVAGFILAVTWQGLGLRAHVDAAIDDVIPIAAAQSVKSKIVAPIEEEGVQIKVAGEDLDRQSPTNEQVRSQQGTKVKQARLTLLESLISQVVRFFLNL